jgi:hypothetical protein
MDCLLNSARAQQGRLIVAWRFIARYVCASELASPLGDDRTGYFRYVLPCLQDFVRVMESVYLAMNHQATVEGPCGTPRTVNSELGDACRRAKSHNPNGKREGQRFNASSIEAL